MSAASYPDAADVVIAGGGTVGLTFALALKQALPLLDVVVVDRERDHAADDERASAIAAAARRMLERLGVWPALAPRAQPITDMIITDSRTSDAVRPVFLTFEGAVDGEPFAHMVPNGELDVGASRQRADGRRDLPHRCRRGLWRGGGRSAGAPRQRCGHRVAASGSGGRRRLAAPRTRRHQHDRSSLRPIRHRGDRRPRTAARTAARKSTSCRAVRSRSCRLPKIVRRSCGPNPPTVPRG